MIPNPHLGFCLCDDCKKEHQTAADQPPRIEKYQEKPRAFYDDALARIQADVLAGGQPPVPTGAVPRPKFPPPPNALDKQVGGDHYKTLKIQPVEYITANNIGFCEGSAIKYLTRWRAKGGVEDLRKARHFIDLLIESEVKL